LAAVAIALGKIAWFESTGTSALTLAIALGMIVGNTLYPRIARAGAGGVTFSKQTLLRLGIILYGLRLTFQDIATVGVPGVDHRSPRIEQYVFAVLVDGHTAFRARSQDGNAHRRRQLDLRRRGRHGHGTVVRAALSKSRWPYRP